MSEGGDEFVSVSEAAEIRGVSRQRVLQWIEDGRLNAQKVGNSYIILKSAVYAVSDRKPGRPPKAKETMKKPQAKKK
jgi:excisionase family DNA binding protein